MSIKHKYVEEIRKGNKLYEYRKIVPADQQVKKILIYSSEKIKKIVAECYIEDILDDTPETLWERTYSQSGISKVHYDKYFKGKAIAHAIKLTRIKFFDEYIPLSRLGVNRAPQSYQYVDFDSL